MKLLVTLSSVVLNNKQIITLMYWINKIKFRTSHEHEKYLGPENFPKNMHSFGLFFL